MKQKILIIVLGVMILFEHANCQEIKKNILIVYGSFSGSTKEIADSMKIHFQSKGCSVDLIPTEENGVEISNYDLVLIGSAIHGNAPHPKVLEYIDRNRNELIKKDVAVFAVCGTITSSKEKKRKNALTYPDKIAHGLNPINKNVFAGNMPSTGKKFDDFMAKLFLGIVPGDFRDWEKIKNWTVETVNKN